MINNLNENALMIVIVLVAVKDSNQSKYWTLKAIENGKVTKATLHILVRQQTTQAVGDFFELKNFNFFFLIFFLN